MSSAVAAAIGGLSGLAVFAVVWALVPPARVDGVTARNGAATTAAGPATAAVGWRTLLARWASFASTRHGVLLGAPATDLELLGRDVPGYLVARLGWAIGGLAAPAVVTVTLLVLGVDASVPFSIALSTAAALACSLVPALSVREQAKAAREEFRRAVGAYLNLIAQQRAAGSSPTQAMTEAADIAQGWQFQRIRAALEHGRRRGIGPWDSLRQLADRLNLTELAELADVMSSASQGTAVATTLSSQAAALRTAAIAADQASANEVSERMIYPVTLLGLGFLLLLVYPAIVRLLSA